MPRIYSTAALLASNREEIDNLFIMLSASICLFLQVLSLETCVCWKYVIEAIINWLLSYFLVHDNHLLSMLELY